MTGSYKERSFEYEIVKWVKKDEYTPHDQKLRTRITPEQLDEAEAVYVKITGGKIDGEEYRYVWGPFPEGLPELEDHIQELFTYGSI